MAQILLTICYDGTAYSGWQSQKNAPSIQDACEAGLAALLGHAVRLRAASRTDAGVHALGQRAVFSTDTKIPPRKLPAAAGAFLPPDISIREAVRVADDFCPRFAARWKTYDYNIWNAPWQNPLACRYATFVPQPLDIERMNAAARHFVGTHDFRAVCAAGGSQKTYTRTIYALDVRRAGSQITLRITGSGFLYNMVRIIAGTLMYAGCGKIAPVDVPGIIAGRQRSAAGKTMPPQGLVLVDVGYSDFEPNCPADCPAF